MTPTAYRTVATGPNAEPFNGKEIWIEWGGRVYGPYRSVSEALNDGFHLPEEKKQATRAD